MAVLPYLTAGVTSSLVRISERFLPILKNSELYLDGTITFEQATDDIVKRIYIYTSLTTVKIICDVVVSSMTGRWIYQVLIGVRGIFKELIAGGLSAFINGMKLSLKHFFVSLRDCPVALISSQFRHIYDKQKGFLSSTSMWNFSNICNQIYFLIIASSGELRRTVQLELVKYWLECMGIIRAIAESLNINFVKYMNRTCLMQQYKGGNPTFTLANDRLSDIPEIRWERAKDPDFFQYIDVTLEDILHGKRYEVKVRREIRKIEQREVEIQEVTYTVLVEAGCPDGKEYRFTEAGHRDPVNISGDLVVKVRIVPHQLYTRNGCDLLYRATISVDEAQAGTSLQVPLITGQTIEFDLYNTNNINKEIIIDHAGLPDPENAGVRGQLIIKWDIELPDAKTGIEPTE